MLCATPQDWQGCRNDRNYIFDMFIFLAILVRSNKGTRLQQNAGLLQDTQDVCTVIVRAHTHISPMNATSSHMITVQRLCAILHGCPKIVTNCTTTNEVRMTDTWQHLQQSCKSASSFLRQPCVLMQDNYASIVQLPYVWRKST